MHLDWILCTAVGDKVSGKYFILQDKVDLHAEMVHAHTMVYGWVDGASSWGKNEEGAGSISSCKIFYNKIRPNAGLEKSMKSKHP